MAIGAAHLMRTRQRSARRGCRAVNYSAGTLAPVSQHRGRAIQEAGSGTVFVQGQGTTNVRMVERRGRPGPELDTTLWLPHATTGTVGRGPWASNYAR